MVVRQSLKGKQMTLNDAKNWHRYDKSIIIHTFSSSLQTACLLQNPIALESPLTLTLLSPCFSRRSCLSQQTLRREK